MSDLKREVTGRFFDPIKPHTSPLAYALTKVYLKYLVPGLTAAVTRNAQARRLMQYYWETVDRCVPPQVILDSLEEVGFCAVRRTIQFGLFNEYTAARPDPGAACGPRALTP